MPVEQNRKAAWPVAYLPLLLGCTGLFLSVLYSEQRFGAFGFTRYSLSEFIQDHRNAIIGSASVAGMLGLLLGLGILHFRSRTLILALGIDVSVLALLWTIFGLSLFPL